MSSVVSSLSSPSVLATPILDPSSPAAASSPSAGIGATTAPPTLYASFGTAFGTGLLGLRAPSNPEDAAMILAEISLAVDAVAREGSDNKFRAVLGAVRGGFAAVQAGLAASAGEIAAKTTEKDAAQTQLAAATGRQGQLEAQKSELAAQIGELNAGIATKTDQKTAAEGEKAALLAQQETTTSSITALTGEIDQLDADIAAARAANDTARVTQLTNTRDAAVASRETQRGILAGVGEQVADKTAEIADLASEITADRAALATASASLTDVETSLQTADASVAAAQATIATLTAQIAALEQVSRQSGLAALAVFGRLAVALQTGDGEKLASDARGTEFDRLLDDVTQHLKAFQQSQLDDVKDQARATREADTQVDESRVAQLALGLVAGLEDLFRTLASLGTPGAPAYGEPKGFDQPYRLAV